MRTKILTLGYLIGVPIRIDATIILAIALVGGVTYGFFPGAWWTSPSMIVILYFSLIAHEMAHVFVGKKIGLSCREVIISLTGTTAYFEGDENHHEALLASAGPILSLFFAIIFGVATAISMELRHIHDLQKDPITGLLGIGAIMNTGIFIFNLLPIYPMDGGRLLHALLLKLTKNHLQAITISSGITVAICLLLIGSGEISLIIHNDSGGIVRVVVAIVLGGQAIGAYKAEVRKSKEIIEEKKSLLP